MYYSASVQGSQQERTGYAQLDSGLWRVRGEPRAMYTIVDESVFFNTCYKI
jgi:hypothetical protein